LGKKGLGQVWAWRRRADVVGVKPLIVARTLTVGARVRWGFGAATGEEVAKDLGGAS
jgi:hypothetical protein